MLELKFMRENVEMLKEMLKNRNSNIDMDAFVALDAKRREVLSEVETLKRDRNNVSAEIANLKKEKKEKHFSCLLFLTATNILSIPTHNQRLEGVYTCA
mgnify:CR=1 FL=1